MSKSTWNLKITLNVNWPDLKYRKVYENLDFERRGLFQLIKSEFRDLKVLYPGSSIHITPSFFFSDVTYVDTSEVCIKFYEDLDLVQRIVEKNKEYKGSGRIRFIAEDFNHISIVEEQFDLLISLNSGRLIGNCLKLIKKGGYILTSDSFSDLEFFKQNKFPLISKIEVKDGKNYSFRKVSKKANRKNMIGKESELRYRDNNTYFVYENKKSNASNRCKT